jgi:hypothetical protein
MAKPLYQKVLDFAVQEWLKHRCGGHSHNS